MKKYLLLSLFLMICSAQIFAGTSTTIRVNPDVDLNIVGHTNKDFSLGSAKASGDASSEAAPAKVYIPMDGPAGLNTYLYFTEPGVTTLFSAVDTTGIINFPLYVNATATDVYLYLAVKSLSDSKYHIAKQASLTPYNGSTNLNVTFPLNLSTICTAAVANCTDFTSTMPIEKKILGYFYFSTSSGTAIGTEVTPDANGAYYEINLSNRIYTDISVAAVLGNVKSGDGRVVLSYSSGTNILQPRAVRVYNHGDHAPAIADNLPIQNYFSSGGGLTATEYTYFASGDVTVTGLVNGTTNYFSILFVDLYKFGTLLSNDKDGSSKSIEELLKKEGCFLLTAGFGEEHYVIDYFRHFRDTVLSKSYLGRQFIKVYYENAPKYALAIYTHESIRAGIRGLAYALYFVFNYIGLILVFLTSGILILYLFKKREKIKI